MPRIVSHGWTACPRGELDRLEAYLRRLRVWKVVGATVIVIAATVAVAAAGWVVADAVQPKYYQGPAGCAPVVPCHPASK